MVVLQTTVGIWVAWGKAGGWKEVFRLPMVYAAAAGLVVGWGHIVLPTFIGKPIEMLAHTAIPLMLVSLGHALQGIRPSAIRIAAFAAVLRIGGGLSVAWLYTLVVGLDGSMRAVVLLSGSMPAAVMNVVLAERYSADHAQVATTVLISTLMAIVTVPAVITWIG
jgi:predicted permease